MKFVVPLFLCLSIAACNPNTPDKDLKPVYFDIAGYVKGQIETLSSQKPTVSKQARINGQVNNQTTTAIDWVKELDLFTQADINKPALRNSYTIARPDSLTYQYTLKPTEEKLTVRSLTVKVDAATHQPAQITALLKTKNPLYESERRLRLESGATPGNAWRIKQYEINGFQQLTYFARNEFRVEGRVNQ